MALDDAIIIPVVTQVDEARSVRSTESFAKKAAPILQKAFTIDAKDILKNVEDVFKKIGKPSSFLNNGIKSFLNDGLAKSIKTRNKLGLMPELRTFKSSGEISKEIARLKELQSMNLDGSKYDASMILSDITFLEKREERFIEAERKIKAALAENFTEQEKLRDVIQQQTKNLETLKQKYIELSTAMSMSENGEFKNKKQTAKTKAELEDLTRQITELDAALRQSKVDLDNLTKPKGLTKFGKFMNRFKSYLSIRVLRNLFSSIEQQFGDSVKNISRFSPELNSTLSSVTSQFTILSNAIATVVVPMLKIVEPILKGITKVASEVASAISFVIAKLTKSSTYLKVNTEYLKDFNQEMNHFSFDKFESLSGDDNSAGMFIEQDVASGLSDSLSDLLVTITAISTVFLAMGASKLGTWLVGEKPKEFFKGLKDCLTHSKTKILEIGSSVAFVYAIYQMITELSDLIKNWDSKSLADKIKGIIKVALYGLGGILIAVGALMSGLGRVATGTVLKIAGISAIAVTGVLDTIGVFANGGMAENGDLFIANDKGPELVYSGANNASSIMNIAQFKQAQFEALQAWWDEAKYDLPETASFNWDGAQVARSKSFISEINRRNTGLNLK